MLTSPSRLALCVPVRLTATVALSGLLLVGPLASGAQASATVPPLGTASAFSVLAGTTITNTGATTIDRSIGVHPGDAVTGEATMIVAGTTHKADAVARQAKADLTEAYDHAAGQTPRVPVGPELGGQTLVAGVYRGASELQVTGTVTLDGENDPRSVWVFQAPSTLITASAASVELINGADACNVFWQVGSSATLGTTTRFVGTIMASESITMNTGATLRGRALARTGAVTLDNNTFSSSECGSDEEVKDPTDDDGDGDSDEDGTGDGDGDTDGDTDGGTDGDTDGGTDGGTGDGTDGGATDQDGSAVPGDPTTGGPQVPTVPTGSVDTGSAGPELRESRQPGFSAWPLALGLGGLALLALRRRRVL